MSAIKVYVSAVGTMGNPLCAYADGIVFKDGAAVPAIESVVSGTATLVSTDTYTGIRTKIETSMKSQLQALGVSTALDTYTFVYLNQ